MRTFLPIAGCFAAGAMAVLAMHWLAIPGVAKPVGSRDGASPAPLPATTARVAAADADSWDPARGTARADRTETPDARASEAPLSYRQWARDDPIGLLAALPGLDPPDASLTFSVDSSPAAFALELAAEAVPERALAIGESRSKTLGARIRAAALEAIAARDSQAALAYLSGVEAGEVRDLLLESIARGFARSDTDGAAAWLATLGRNDGAAFYPVIEAVALVDLPRAIDLDDLAIGLDYGGPGYGDLSWLPRALRTYENDPARMADKAAGSASKGVLADTLSWWVIRDPNAAIGWMSSRRTISRFVLDRVAGELAQQDYRQAIDYAAQMPSGLSAAWIESVLESAATIDTAGVLDTLESFNNEPFYADALNAILQRAEPGLGPVRTAALAGNLASSRLAERVISEWMPIDPVAAEAWALALVDEQARQRAATNVVGYWRDTDPRVGLNWVERLLDPELRKNMLLVLCGDDPKCREE